MLECVTLQGIQNAQLCVIGPALLMESHLGQMAGNLENIRSDEFCILCCHKVPNGLQCSDSSEILGCREIAAVHV